VMIDASSRIAKISKALNRIRVGESLKSFDSQALDG
jgi:hypothetical protein